MSTHRVRHVWLLNGMAGLVGACILGVGIMGIGIIFREQHITRFWYETTLFWLWSFVILGVHATLGLMATVLRRRVMDDHRHLGSMLELAVVLFLAAGGVFIATLFWSWNSSLSGNDENYPRMAGMLLIVGFMLLQAGAMMQLSVKGETMRWARRGVVGWFTLTGLMAIGLIWFGEYWGQTLSANTLNLLATSMVLLVIGSLLGTAGFSAAVRRQERQAKGQRESLSKKLKIKMSCPACEDNLELPTGLARCPSCGYGMMIEVEEPRCECGYLLYKLVGENCPECGRNVGEDPEKAAGGS